MSDDFETLEIAIAIAERYLPKDMYASREEIAEAKQALERVRSQLVSAKGYLAACQKAITQIEQIADLAGVDKLELLNSISGIRNIIKSLAYPDEDKP